MATTVNPITGEILVPRADMPVVQVSPEIRELDVDAWRLELHAIADDVDMRPWPKMFLHNTQYILSGITYVRAMQIIDPYYVTFEDGQYAVRLVGGNNNILDVKTANQVSLLAANSAGKQVVIENVLTVDQEVQLQLILDLLEADEEHTPTSIIKRIKGTQDNLLVKDVVGSGLTKPLTITAP